jgi:hypothetical protein
MAQPRWPERPISLEPVLPSAPQIRWGPPRSVSSFSHSPEPRSALLHSLPAPPALRGVGDAPDGGGDATTGGGGGAEGGGGGDVATGGGGGAEGGGGGDAVTGGGWGAGGAGALFFMAYVFAFGSDLCGGGDGTDVIFGPGPAPWGGAGFTCGSGLGGACGGIAVTFGAGLAAGGSVLSVATPGRL